MSDIDRPYFYRRRQAFWTAVRWFSLGAACALLLAAILWIIF